MTVITQIVGCNKSAKAFQRMDDFGVLMVRESKRIRVGDVKEMDRMDSTMRALVSNNNVTSTREKSMAKALLKVLESEGANYRICGGRNGIKPKKGPTTIQILR
ncbi:hypothetical protein MUK42_21417 [Musa troglodytarum]|uniref:Uncharacterized protein n=1 Tax=Musa troglodytarum TaxID=320322 RepID=A0A9E7FV50_9LILI|nr:hypothetical protein MUK42_21417 [Musa troglodytarum]